MFENLNTNSDGLDYLEANGAEELKGFLKQITLPCRIIAIYAQGAKHYAWIQTQAKIIKKSKREMNNGNS